MLEAHGSNVLFLAGVIHTEWANSIWPGGRETDAELVCVSISASNVDEQLRLRADNGISQLAEELMQAANPHVRHVGLDAHGHAIAHVRRDEEQMQWPQVDGVEFQRSPVRETVAMVWREGVVG